jgi:membrane protease YdiL (CAAX protease family)
VNTLEESAYTGHSLSTPPGPIEPHAGGLPSGPQFHANNPPWGLPQALLTWFLSLALLVCVQVIVSLAYIAYRHRQGIIPNIQTLTQDKTFMFINVLSYFPIHLLTFMLGWAVVTQMGRFDFWQTIGWSWPANLGLWKSAGLAILLFAMALVLSGLFGGQETDIERLVQSSRPTAYALAILAVATAPLVEEVVYRGILYPALQRAIGMGGAVTLVAGLFAVGHVYQYWPNFGVISAIVLLSVSLTLVRARTGRLLPCFIIHLVFNGIQSVGIVVAPYIRVLDSGGEQKAASILMAFRFLLRFV